MTIFVPPTPDRKGSHARGHNNFQTVEEA